MIFSRFVIWNYERVLDILFHQSLSHKHTIILTKIMLRLTRSVSSTYLLFYLRLELVIDFWLIHYSAFSASKAM